MELSKEDLEKIIDITTERVLLKLPETVGNMMSSLVTMIENRKKFYNDHPELVDHKELVMKLYEQIDGESMGQSYDEVVNKLLPLVRQKLSIKNSLSKSPVKTIDSSKQYGNI